MTTEINTAVTAAAIRQGQLGQIITIEGSTDVLGDDLAVVLSHDCDILSAEEDQIEFAKVATIDRCDGNFTYGKNPRRLHADLPGIGSVSIEMKSRFCLNRDIISSIRQNSQFAGRDLYTLQRWLANRYSRSAFPDEFNRRRRPAKSAVKKALAKGEGGQHLSGLYVAIDDTEYGSGQDYEIVVVGAMPAEDYEQNAARVAAESTVSEVARLLDNLTGIRVADFMALSEAQITLDQLTKVKRLDFDDLSTRPQRIGPDPVEG